MRARPVIDRAAAGWFHRNPQGGCERLPAPIAVYFSVLRRLRHQKTSPPSSRTKSDLPRRQPRGIRTENLSNLAHGQPFFGHRSPWQNSEGASRVIPRHSASKWGWPICVGMGGRFGSEYPADLPRNQWPINVGIRSGPPGRLSASASAACIARYPPVVPYVRIFRLSSYTTAKKNWLKNACHSTRFFVYARKPKLWNGILGLPRKQASSIMAYCDRARRS